MNAQKWMRFVLAAGVSILALGCMAAVSHAVELTLYCNPTQLPALREVVADWEKETGNSVVLQPGFESSSESFAHCQKLLEDENTDFDIYNIDSIWTSMIAKHLVDLRVFLNGMEQLHLPGVIDNYTIDGRLTAMPLFVDAGVMYYRKDLLDKYNLPLPFTWNRLIECANKVVTEERAAGNDNLWGLVFQGAPYEGLTCCALEWLYANDAGTIVDENGHVTVNNPQAVKTLAEAREWIGSLVPEKTLSFTEEDSRQVFRDGHAVFMRNWPYAWPHLQNRGSAVRDKVGVMPVPKGTPNGRSPGVMGGWGLAVSKYSKNREAAANLIFYLTGPMGQKKFCLLDNHIPSLTSLFYDPEVRKQIPMAVQEFFTATVQRPARHTGGKYYQASKLFYTTVHSILSGETSAETGLAQLEKELNKFARNNWK